MLGEKLGSMTTTSVNKALPSERTLPKFEVTAQGSGTIVRVPIQFMGTYLTEMKTDGNMYGECPNSSILMASDGVATAKASCVGRTEHNCSTKFHVIFYIEATAPFLVSLNEKAIIQEYDVGAERNAACEMWYWV